MPELFKNDLLGEDIINSFYKVIIGKKSRQRNISINIIFLLKFYLKEFNIVLHLNLILLSEFINQEN